MVADNIMVHTVEGNKTLGVPVRLSIIRSDRRHLWMVVQVKPFRKLRKVHNKGKRTRLRDLIRYDLRQMHAAFSGTLPVGSSAESLGHMQVCT